jgi:hypothetical protein
VQTERYYNAIANLLDLYIFEAFTLKTRLGRNKIGRWNSYVKAIASSKCFVIVK